MEDTLTELGRRIVQASQLAAAMHFEAALRSGGVQEAVPLEGALNVDEAAEASAGRWRWMDAPRHLARRWFR